MHFLQRRSFLKTVSLGVSTPLLAPFLARLQAEQKGETPARVVFFIEGNGLPPKHIQPNGISRNEEPNPRGGPIPSNAEAALVDVRLNAAEHRLPEHIAPLERHLSRLTIVQGLSGRVCGGGHSNGCGALGAYSAGSGAKDITIDCALAKANPAIYGHVTLGVSSDPRPNIIEGCSVSGPSQRVPYYQDPALAYNMLFGKILGGNPKAEVGAQALLLDFMSEDIGRLEKQLPREEAHKLRRYTEAFASLSTRQARLGEIDPRKIPARRDDLYLSAVETRRVEAHFEVAATALITGLTNTVTLASGALGYPKYTGLGINTDTHTIGHGYLSEAEPRALDLKIRQFHATQLAAFVDRLAAVPEGKGTMMDNTLIVYLSDSAEFHHSFCLEWPMVLIGNLGGRLNAGGRYVNFPKYGTKGHGTMARFYTALLHAMGSPVRHFGMKDKVLEGAVEQDGPLHEFLA